MNKIQEDIQMVINTIQALNITAEYDTMNKLMGCLQLLGKMKTEAANWVVVKNETAKEAVGTGNPGDSADQTAQ